MSFDQIPLELRQRHQWVCRAGKVPFQPNGKLADPTLKETWSSFDEVVAGCARRPETLNGLGFVFSKDDPYCGIDLDEPKTSDEVARHRRLITAFNSYTELSPSGNGLHIICRASLPVDGKRKHSLEMYVNRRYFTVTGNVCYGKRWIVDCQSQVNELYAELWGGLDEKPTRVGLVDVSSVQSSLSDDAVIALCKTVKNSAAIFQRLMDGITSDFAHGDLSRIDFIFCNYVSAHTKDVEQIERIFRCAGIGKRDITEGSKYYNQSRNYANYIERTIRNSLRFNDVLPFAKKGV